MVGLTNLGSLYNWYPITLPPLCKIIKRGSLKYFNIGTLDNYFGIVGSLSQAQFIGVTQGKNVPVVAAGASRGSASWGPRGLADGG